MRSEAALRGFSTAGRGGVTRSDRLRIAVVVLGVGGGVAERATTARHGLASLPIAAQDPISAALGSEAPAYRVTGLEAVNPAQHLRARFSRPGMSSARRSR